MESQSDKYKKQLKTWKVLELEVHAKPLKLRWKILSYDINRRLNDYVKKAGGFTDEEMKDTEYAALVNAYEHSFFSESYDPNTGLVEQEEFAPSPKRQPTGPENLAELLSVMAEEEIDWAKFITDNIGRYKEIRDTGLEIYYDFFFEILRLQEM